MNSLKAQFETWLASLPEHLKPSKALHNTLYALWNEAASSLHLLKEQDFETNNRLLERLFERLETIEARLLELESKQTVKK